MDEIALNDLTPEELEAAPHGFKELCRMTSVPEALKLCERFGGLELVMPAAEGSKRTHLSEVRLAFMDLLCPSSCERLLSEWGECKFYFPRLDGLKEMRRNRLIQQAFDQATADKKTTSDLINGFAVKYQVSRRQIYRILKRTY